MTGLMVEETYPSHRHTLTTCTGTEHSGHAAKNMFSRKNGAQQSTNMKKTRPNTLLAFCSVATAFAANDLLFVLPGRNLGRTRNVAFVFALWIRKSGESTAICMCKWVSMLGEGG